MNPKETQHPPGDDQSLLVIDERRPCVGLSPDTESACSCIEKDYLIKEEEDALSELRRIKKQATLSKKRFHDLQREIDPELLKMNEDRLSPEERAIYAQQKKFQAELRECERSIEELRSEWKDWDEKRKQATKKKMILLGHIS